MSLSARYLQDIGLGPLWVSRRRQPDSVDAPVSDEAGENQNASVSLPSHLTQPAIEPTRMQTGGRGQAIAKMDWTELVSTIKTCTACRLCETRTQAVPGVGDVQADWLVVGEAPGADEDRRGEPFVGRAGQLLDNMLLALGLKRGQGVYIANVLKCRPPGNRDPEIDEIGACRGYLQRQIELIQPKVILCVGRFAANTLLGRDDKVGQLRGQVHDYQGIPLVVSYHPAYLLRNPADKSKAWQDLIRARRALAAA